MDDGLFKIASENHEFKQINKMIYETFVEEIPRYNPNPNKVLVDKFHEHNKYIICINKGTLVGMLAISEKRPFSLDHKLENLDAYLPDFNSICEVRLLAIQKRRRYSGILRGLFSKTIQYCLDKGHDIAIISGILKQQKLYKHIGFVPFGPIVGTPEASFQPMYLTPQDHFKAKTMLANTEKQQNGNNIVNLLPGPVKISPEVKKAFNEPAISHRNEQLAKLLNTTKGLLIKLTNGKNVELLTGSGTLANDVIAGQLSLIDGKGLILTNGEFGERLIANARGCDLSFETIRFPWGKTFDSKAIEQALKKYPQIKWLWSAHCETSTGMLNDIDSLKKICTKNGVLLCQDCISSLGNTYLDLNGIHLASGVSGKGLGCYSGICMVFYDHLVINPEKRLPSYMDVKKYSEENGIPFTINSNIIKALHAAVMTLKLENKIQKASSLLALLREELCKIDLYPVVSDKYNCPSVLTIALPQQFDSDLIGLQLEKTGFLLNYKSQYLLKRNWIQICLMADVSQNHITSMIETFKQIIKHSAKPF